MTVLLLKLSGPLQAWGNESRFTRRMTEREPTKSGIIGLIASAMGCSREDSLEDFAELEFGVRVDQKGRLLRDFQTERSLDGKTVMPLSQRYYIADAKYLAALSGDDALLKRADNALNHPRWPLYLGRRSCPPDAPLSLGLHSEYADVREALSSEPWIAAEWYKKKHAADGKLDAYFDAREGERGEMRNDAPITFSLKGRRYAERRIVHCPVNIPGAVIDDNAGHSASFFDAELNEHDPFSFL